MPDTIRTEDFTNNLLALLIETFESPRKPSSAYLDQNTGLFDTLNKLSVEQAAKPVTEGGTSIAGQVKHIKFYIDVLEQIMDGHNVEADWQGNWQVGEVTPEVWDALKADLKTSYERLSQRLNTTSIWGDEEVGDSIAILVHTAYHLGALRQIVRVVA